MRVLSFLFLGFLAAVVFTGACHAQDGKWGVVDIARVMRDSDPGKAGMKFIETLQADMQKQLDEIQGKLEKDPTNQELMQQLQKVYASLQQSFQKESANVANIIFDTVQKALNKFRAANGYNMLLGAEAVASFDPALDVTEAVLAEVNKEKIDFKAAAQLAPPAESTPKTREKPKPAETKPEK